MAGRRGTVEPARDEIVVISVLLPIPARRAYDFFTSSALLQSWLAPVAEVEPETGGRYELFWDPADRENNSTIGCRVTAVLPGQFIAFQWRSPKQFKEFANAADPLTHVVVFFVPEGDGTRVHLIHSGWRDTAEWEAARAWQERAWTGAFRQLEEVGSAAPSP